MTGAGPANNPLNFIIMVTLTTHIQEVTLQAYVLGAYDILFNQRSMSRDEVLNTFEAWGREFAKVDKKHCGETDWFYYDEVDNFIYRKIAELKEGKL